MSAENRVNSGSVNGSGLRSLLTLTLTLTIAGCSWFTDFKQQPKIDPWESPDTNTSPRGNPQGSVPLYGSAAPEFLYPRTFQGLVQMTSLANPVPMSKESADRGRKSYQVNCSACHGPAGMASQTAPMFKFGIYAPSIGAGSNAANTLSDGYIFGIIRNGRGLMPSYNRIEEPTRWDIINYLRTLQGKGGIAIDTTHGRPGETGQYLLGATMSAPTRPAPYFNSMRDMTKPTRDTTVRRDSASAQAKPPAAPAPAAKKPPTPEAEL